MPNINSMFTQKCYVCKRVLSFSEFYPNRWRASGIHGECKECSRKQTKQRRINNPNMVADDRRYNIKRKYRISVLEYDLLFAAQLGLCSICKQPETAMWKGRPKPLAVDHCHVTGENRGLLCSKCNVGLGYFRESAELLKAAITYLQTHQTT